MLLRLLIAIIVLSTWGCESHSLNHRTSDATQWNQPKLSLTSLSKTEPVEPSPLLERLIIPEKQMEEVITQETSQAEPFPTIYFPFNSWEITPEVQKDLDATASWMTHFSTYGLTIEGHTDIRGSEGYNMVLGVKRAKAVKEYLATLGIPRSRLDIVSYGNTLVLCEVDDEQRCHQFNRRADLLLE